MLEEDVEAVVAHEKKQYDEAIASGPALTAGSNVDLDMRVLLVHGDQVISDSNDGGLTNACRIYKEWLSTLDI